MHSKIYFERERKKYSKSLPCSYPNMALFKLAQTLYMHSNTIKAIVHSLTIFQPCVSLDFRSSIERRSRQAIMCKYDFHIQILYCRDNKNMERREMSWVHFVKLVSVRGEYCSYVFISSNKKAT